MRRNARKWRRPKKKPSRNSKNRRNNIKKTIQELNDKLEETREIAKDLQTLLDETEQINDHLLKEHMNKQEPKPSTNQENLPRPKPNQTKKILIADSNRKYISPHLDTEESDWAVMSGVYTTDELLDLIDSGKHNDTLKQQEIVVIMLGTNDIRGSKGRKEKSGSQVYTQLLKACDKITTHLNIPTAIVQMWRCWTPGWKQPKQRLPRLSTPKTSGKNPKTKILQKDGFHFTETGGKK